MTNEDNEIANRHVAMQRAVEPLAHAESRGGSGDPEIVVPAPAAPTQVYSLRIPVERLAQLRRVADRRGMAPSALMRTWVLAALDAEDAESSSEDLSPTFRYTVVLDHDHPEERSAVARGGRGRPQYHTALRLLGDMGLLR